MLPVHVITSERKKELSEKADSQITRNVLDELYLDLAMAVSSGIARAFARDAALYDDDINVSANDGHVTLWGTVTTLSERDMAEGVAWRSPGVRSVRNNITIDEGMN